MAPNDVLAILARMDQSDKIQLELVKQVAALDAKLDAKLDEREHQCEECKASNDSIHGQLFEKYNWLKNKFSEMSGIKIGKQEAADESDKERTKRLATYGLIFTAGGSLATIIGYWPTIKKVIGL